VCCPRLTPPAQCSSPSGCGRVERLPIPCVGGGGSLRVTASFGVAPLPESAGDAEELVAAADSALYRAKRGGKSRVERAERVVAAS
jgi:diguanylate cyclase (GGDEF)-like protein